MLHGTGECNWPQPDVWGVGRDGGTNCDIGAERITQRCPVSITNIDAGAYSGSLFGALFRAKRAANARTDVSAIGSANKRSNIIAVGITYRSPDKCTFGRSFCTAFHPAFCPAQRRPILPADSCTFRNAIHGTIAIKYADVLEYAVQSALGIGSSQRRSIIRTVGIAERKRSAQRGPISAAQ